VGSRVRIAAATCFVASGLFVGGLGGALAFATPSPGSGSHENRDGTKADTSQNGGTGSRPGEKNPDQGKPRDQKPGDQTPGDGKPDDQNTNDPKPDDPKPSGEVDPNPGDGDDGGSTPTSPKPTTTKPTTTKPTPTTETPTSPRPTPTTEPPPPTRDPDPGQCDDKGENNCGAGFPWWPFPWPPEPGDPGPGGPGGGGGGGLPSAGGGLPSGLPHRPPMQLPGAPLPETQRAVPVEPVNATPGASLELPLEPITMPVVVAPPPALGFGGAGRPAPPEQLKGLSRGEAETPAGRQLSPADIGSNVTIPPASYRVGYTDYLRTAGISQVVALAVPGVAGILVLTGAGGFVGYRQAKAGHAVRTRTGGAARFVN
jgi:hypothetical protein